jgi:hypothetical protein
MHVWCSLVAGEHQRWTSIMNRLEVAKAFRTAISENFKSYLETLGFKRTKNEADEDGFSIIYRNGESYVHSGGTLHPHDHPFYFWLTFGRGSDQMPECDWNSTALWRMIQPVSSEDHEEHATLYDIPDGITPAQIEEKIRIIKRLCEQYGDGFLSGDLSLFKKVRAAMNKDREPYKVYSPNSDGTYSMDYDAESSKLKDKYSK